MSNKPKARVKLSITDTSLLTWRFSIEFSHRMTFILLSRTLHSFKPRKRGESQLHKRGKLDKSISPISGRLVGRVFDDGIVRGEFY